MLGCGVQPGVRYIRRIVMGKVSMLRVELLKGREIPGKQSSWLVTLKGFKTREEVITFFQVMF